MKTTTLLLAFLLFAGTALAQGVAINETGAAPDPSAMLDVSSIEKGALVPRMTLAKRNLIPLPANGLLIYQTNNNPGFYYNAGTPSSPDWQLIGSNAGTFSQWTSSGNDIYYNQGHVGIGTAEPTALLHAHGTGSGQGNVLFTGELKVSAQGDPPATGAGTRMMWYPDKAAFRAGRLTEAGSINWDKGNIGLNSAAMGSNTTASGNASFAMGTSSSASGSSSIAMGWTTHASGSSSIAVGNSTTASGNFSTAMGRGAKATGESSFAIHLSSATAPEVPANTFQISGANNTIISEGNVGIGTTAPTRKLDINGQIRIRQGAAAGRVLMSDADGTASWQELASITETDPTWSGAANTTGDIGRTGNVGIGVSEPTAKLHVDGGIFMTTGAYNSGPELPAAVTSPRMFFYPRKAAFRAGAATGTQWNDANVGNYSTAMGYNTEASGMYSTAMGGDVKAQGDYSTALGALSEAIGNRSTAMGNTSKANGLFSTAIGDRTIATGQSSTALGSQSRALGNLSFAIHLSNSVGPEVPANTFRISGATNTIISEGNVGIGTTAPTQKLDINGQIRMRTGAATGKVLMSDADGTASWQDPPTEPETDPTWSGDANISSAISRLGPVGIGTMTPTSNRNLTIYENGAAWLAMQNFSTGTAPTDGLLIGNSDKNAYLWNLENADMSIGTNNQDQIMIKANGNVGIGTTSPATKLDVEGAIKIANTEATPEAGMVRWNAETNDFEGFDGDKWRSLTKANSGTWGLVAPTTVSENQKGTASDGAADDYFGNSVSISGDYAIVGAPQHNTGGNTNQGAAYIFLRTGNTWAQQAKLIASDGEGGDRFGASVSISGDYAIVGAHQHNTGGNISQGAAYVYYRSGTSWAQQAKLIASDGAQFDRFGGRVSISGDYAIVGARWHNTGGNNNQGAAYVFERAGMSWIQQAKLIASDGAADDHFGSSVSISGDYAIVGAHQHNTGGNTNQGAAYVFERAGMSWIQQAKLIASDGAANDLFGTSVSISGDYAIVGARWHTPAGGNNFQGAAYVYYRSGTGWAQQRKLIAADGAANDLFGTSVSISGGYAIVGAHQHNIGGNSNQGAAYIFLRTGTTWAQQAKLIASDGAANDLFGTSVSISGDYAIVGAPYHHTGGNLFQGAVYFFNK